MHTWPAGFDPIKIKGYYYHLWCCHYSHLYTSEFVQLLLGTDLPIHLDPLQLL